MVNRSENVAVSNASSRETMSEKVGRASGLMCWHSLTSARISACSHWRGLSSNGSPEQSRSELTAGRSSPPILFLLPLMPGMSTGLMFTKSSYTILPKEKTSAALVRDLSG